jgi:hypothetical protein
MTKKYTIQKHLMGEVIILEEDDQPTKFIPFDEGNMDYVAYLAWVAEGNTAPVNDITPPPAA